MVDTPNNNQLRSQGPALASLQEQTTAEITDASADRLVAQGLRATRRLDERTTIAARAAYRQRWMELQGELADAVLFNDLARPAKVRAELGFFAAELATGYGYCAHSRTASETTENVRTAATNRLRAAVAKKWYVHPALWQYQGPRQGPRKYRSGRAPPV